MNNTPNIGPYTELKPFRFWCQKVLPLVYDESLSYYELLCKVVDYLNKTMEDVDQMIVDMGKFHDAYAEFTADVDARYLAFTTAISEEMLQFKTDVNTAVTNLENFVNDYFDNLDVQDEIDHKIDEMAEDGYFDELFVRVFGDNVIGTAQTYVTAWISNNLSQQAGFVVDKSLTVDEAAADAKTTGDKINDLTISVNNLFDGKGFFRNLTYGSLNAAGELVPANTYWLSSNDWFIPKYPLKFEITDSDYSGKMYFDDEGTVSSVNILTHGDVLYPGRKTKISFWKTSTYTALNFDEAKQKIKVQTEDAYLSKYGKMAIDKINNGTELFPGYIRRGSIGASNGIYVDYIPYRCATPLVNRYQEDITIKAESGFKFAVQLFSTSDVFVEDLGWKTDYTVPAGQGFKMIIARTVEDTTEYAAIDEFLQGINIVSLYVLKKDIFDVTFSLFNNGYLQNGGKAHLAAHMGYHVAEPANSNPAYIAAGTNNYWGIESDVQQTADGHFVMMHDIDVSISTNGSGNVNELTLAQIRALHLTGTDYLVPTLEEFLGICKRYACVPVIELKSTVTAEGMADIVELIKDYGLDKTCIVLGSKWAISQFRAASSVIPYLSVYQSGFSFDFDEELELNNAYPNTGMDWDYLSASPVDIIKAKKLHDKSMIFGTFTIDNANDVLAAFMAGVDFVTTNTVLP